MLRISLPRLLVRRLHGTPYIRAQHSAADTSANHINTAESPATNGGQRTYVIAPKEDAPYDVPSGAYASTDAYATPPATSNPESSELASTSPTTAHPNTTARVPHHPDGVGSSASVRFRSAPGDMAQGSDGGLGLMDAEGVTGSNELASRNPPPDENGGRQGLGEAWKHRK